jgi:hypothetical protein
MGTTLLIVIFADGWFTLRTLPQSAIAAVTGVCNGAGNFLFRGNLNAMADATRLENFLSAYTSDNAHWELVFSDKKPSILASDGRLDGDDRDFLFYNFLYHKDKELALGFRLPAFLDELVETQLHRATNAA